MDDFYEKINKEKKEQNESLINKDVYIDKYALWRKVMFSDTMNFDSDNYVIFTHSVSIRTKPSDFYYGFGESEKTYSPSEDSFDIAFNPHELKKKKRISVALTTSEDNFTYGRIGYIVSAPVENILYVGQAPFDKTNEELRQLPLKSPQEVQNDMFREVVLEGSTIHGIVKPIGIFVNLNGATEEEIIHTMFLLEQIKKVTNGVFPVLNLSDKNYRLENNSDKKTLI